MCTYVLFRWLIFCTVNIKPPELSSDTLLRMFLSYFHILSKNAPFKLLPNLFWRNSALQYVNQNLSNLIYICLL
jgi:hypothetical protein